MKKLIRSFVDHTFYANMIVVFLLFAGIAGMLNMKKALFPEIESKNILISVVYRGASPEEMEEGIATKIEESLRGVVGIKETTSTSSENFVSVSIETTGQIDIDEVLIEVKNAVDGISSFPNGAEKPSVYKVRSKQQVARMSIWGDADLHTIKQYADEVEEDLLASGKVSQVEILNPPTIEISIEVAEETLNRYRLTFTDIANAVSSNNQDLAGGQIKSDEEEMLIRLRSRSDDPGELATIIVASREDGGPVYLRDIAEIKKQFDENYYGVTMNGKPSLGINVSKLPGEDLEEISEYCTQYAQKFNAKNLGVNLEVTFSFLELLHSRLELLMNNGFTGLILVVLSLALFLSFRLSLWVAWGIPSAFLGMFFLAPFLGLTINMISLFGMILVIGILVDDGIVIAENIYAHFESGKTAKQAAIDGTIEVLPSIITSVLTTMVAFSPLLFLTGGHMEFLKDMAVVVVSSLGISLIEAFFVLPSHLASPAVLRQKSLDKKDTGVRAWLDKRICWLRDVAYERTLKWILAYRYAVLISPAFLLMITIGLIKGGFIRFTFFPSIDFDQFSINIAFGPGNGEKQTRDYLYQFEDAVWAVNEDLKEELGEKEDFIKYTYVKIGTAFSGQESGAHAGMVEVFPRNLEDLPVSGITISERVREKIGKVPEAQKFSVAGFNRWGSPVSISLLGRNIDELDMAKNFLLSALYDMDELKNIVDNNALGKQEIVLKLKKKAYSLGLTQTMVANQVRQGFYGHQIQLLQSGRDELRIWVRYPPQDRMNMGQLDDMKIKTPQGQFPLSQLCNYEITRGPVNIRHYDGAREIRVEADTKDAEAELPKILGSIKSGPVAELESRFPSVRVEFLGQQKNSKESGADMQRLYKYAFLIMFAIVMIQFRNAEQAIIILLMIPLSLFGAIWGHGLHGKVVSMLSAWGIVALSGVIINDAVVFLSKFNSLIIEGFKLKDAIIEAGKSRLRPILLTTLTTSIGLYPLILERSFQAQFLIPMAISLAYGVAVGTLFILLYFPVFIHVLNDIKRALYKLWTGKSISQEDVEPALRSLQEEMKK